MSAAQREAIVAGYVVLIEQLEQIFRLLDADQRLRVSIQARNFANHCAGALAAIEQQERADEGLITFPAALKGTASE